MEEKNITQDTNTSTVSENEVLEGKTFTQAEVNEIIGSKLRKHDKKNEELIKQIISRERAEAERLAKMTAEEKEKELIQRYKADIETKEKALLKRELHLETTSILNEKQIPIDLANFFIGEDIETTKSNIDSFEKLYKKAIEKGINEKLKGKPIEDYGGGVPTKIKDVIRAF